MARKFNKYIVSMVLVLAFFANVFAVSASALVKVADKKRVLFLSSYAYSWGSVPFQISGVSGILEDKYILNYEFMDTKNTIYSDGYKEFYELLKYKLSSREKYDVIIAADDAALNFVQIYEDELFKDIPVVFEGIDNIENATKAAENPLFTGIVENVDYDANIKLASTLIPDANKLVFILDDLENGIGIEKQLEESKDIFENYDVSYINSADYTYKELCEKLDTLDDSCIAFCISMGRGKDSLIYTEEERYAILRAHVKIPLFRVTQSGMSEGAFLGGYVIKHDECGKIVGEMAEQILNGTSPSDIPVEYTTPHEYYFDNNILKKFGYTENDIPPDSVIVNKAPDFLEQHYRTIFSIILLMIIILLIILLYLKIQTNTVLREKNKVLEDANNAKTDFLARMSHDIRTPMNAVIGLAQLGMDECKDQSADEYFNKINSSGTYLLGLLNDILDMSKIESSKIELHEEVIDSKQYFNNIVTMLTPMFEARKITLETHFSQIKIPYIYCDKLRMKQIYSNLLSNAVKFSEPGSKVEWTVRDISHDEEALYFEVTIRDYGCGMSEKFQKKLFDPFTQEKNNSTDRNPSTGLGLAICKNLIEQMGGTISVESKLGDGSTFTINLHHRISKEPPEPAKITEIDTADFSGRRILIAEDHPINREITTKLLRKKGINVTQAVNGKKAVELFSQSEPFYFSAILMDIKMPELDGIEATKAIRKLNRSDSKCTPIIALSANAFDDDKKQCLEAGMNDHLPKPINPSQLFETLARYVK